MSDDKKKKAVCKKGIYIDKESLEQFMKLEADKRNKCV